MYGSEKVESTYIEQTVHELADVEGVPPVVVGDVPIVLADCEQPAS